MYVYSNCNCEIEHRLKYMDLFKIDYRIMHSKYPLCLVIGITKSKSDISDIYCVYKIIDFKSYNNI